MNPFDRWGNQSSEGVRILPRVKQLLSGRSWVWTQVYLVPKSTVQVIWANAKVQWGVVCGSHAAPPPPPPAAHRVTRPFPVQTLSWIPELGRCSGEGAELGPWSLSDLGLDLPPKSSTGGSGSLVGWRDWLGCRQAEAPAALGAS